VFSFFWTKQPLLSRPGRSYYLTSSHFLCKSWQKGQLDKRQQDGRLTGHKEQIRALDRRRRHNDAVTLLRKAAMKRLWHTSTRTVPEGGHRPAARGQLGYIRLAPRLRGARLSPSAT